MATRISKALANKLGLTRPKPGARVSDTLRDELLAQIKLAGLPEPKLEVTAAELGIPDRKWRYDMGWHPAYHPKRIGWVLIELQGSIWSKVRGAHSTGQGIERDISKLNAALLAGHVCLQASVNHIHRGEALRWIAQALGIDGNIA